uniref:Uncharacterized protein n=1 Tax=Rhizophora mucronata TaxID=61149 RepID=A0A2P2MXW6_RHIMU
MEASPPSSCEKVAE